ncbi:hypothetical protein AB8939_03135 [Yersinia enterocolitica]|uniref:hypothetical protein n=1 Tax=Yersinia enterocolitica TaxID=630 RepID=UPI002AC46239|nr:hypothetical protein [Yersinia enterocolitica]
MDMINDFDFIRIPSASFAEPLDVFSMRRKINEISKNYCLRHYSDSKGASVDLISELRDASYSLTPYAEFKELWGVLSPAVKHKEDICIALVDHFNKIKNKYPSVGSVKVSCTLLRPCINLPLSDDERHSHFSMKLKETLGRFFNRLRSNATLSSFVVGYTWVILRDALDGYPYVHINFYTKHDKVNEKLGYEITKSWLSCVNPDSPYKVKNKLIPARWFRDGYATGSGIVRHFSFSSNFSNTDIMEDFHTHFHVNNIIKNIIDIDYFRGQLKIIFVDDFNQHSILKHSSIEIDERALKSYFLSLAKEACCYYKTNTFFQTPAIDKDKNTGKKRMFRTYGISGVK